MDLYIYYRVPVGNSAQLERQAAALQTRLSQQLKVATELKRRPQDKDGMHTWMEVYLDVPDGFEAALQEAVADTGLDALIDGARHIEHFLDFSPCA
ncbi:DUF4936 family protein [Herbaspirillum sp. RV1423]|uniref:DUF4936 family protein n=1 Tax=Herbaspirillum sp. RV1423 TaxID=1443993 RepID=UPI0004B99DD2|nr:DUF4936 family protein [Herbaspirillum sp. RV1423]